MTNFSNCLVKFVPEANSRYTTTDIGNSNLFADYYRDVARYVPERKMWCIFTGKPWEPDPATSKPWSYVKNLRMSW